MINKKAAMFGLDARIALAIFGSLSIIASVALFGILNKIEVVTMVNEFNEIGKAWEAYYVDTRSPLEGSGVTSVVHAKYYRKMWNLLESNKKRWKGPYLDYEKGDDVWKLQHPQYDTIGMILTKDVEWGSSPSNSWDSFFCDDDNPCYVWVMLYGMPRDLVNKIDKYVDGEIGWSKGSFRAVDFGNNIESFYKYSPADIVI